MSANNERSNKNEDFHSSEYKNKITSIVTKGDTVIEEGVIESWDISEKQNGTVVAYIEDDGTNNGTYKLTMGGEDKIVANYDMNSYFSSFPSLTSINLNYLDIYQVTDMSWMFGFSRNITEINLSNFNTSKVTDYKAMFNDLTNITQILVSKNKWTISSSDNIVNGSELTVFTYV